MQLKKSKTLDKIVKIAVGGIIGLTMASSIGCGPIYYDCHPHPSIYGAKSCKKDICVDSKTECNWVERLEYDGICMDEDGCYTEDERGFTHKVSKGSALYSLGSNHVCKTQCLNYKTVSITVR